MADIQEWQKEKDYKKDFRVLGRQLVPSLILILFTESAVFNTFFEVACVLLVDNMSGKTML